MKTMMTFFICVTVVMMGLSCRKSCRGSRRFTLGCRWSRWCHRQSDRLIRMWCHRVWTLPANTSDVASPLNGTVSLPGTSGETPTHTHTRTDTGWESGEAQLGERAALSSLSLSELFGWFWIPEGRRRRRRLLRAGDPCQTVCVCVRGKHTVCKFQRYN